MSDFEIVPDAPPSVLAALEQAKGIEDVSFSPNNRRLALAGCYGNSIAIADVHIATDGGRTHVTLSAMTEYPSPLLNGPHGVDFLDDETIIVANREGNITAFRLPAGEAANSRMTPLDPPPGHRFELLETPGSLAVRRVDDGEVEVLVCNSHSNTVTAHTLQTDPLAVTSNDVLLRRWLAYPDGLALTNDGEWIAVSGHHNQVVTLYARSSSLRPDSDPDCVLRGVSHPHGLRFSADGRHLVVAGCGAPYVHVFTREGPSWRGVQYPSLSVRVMDDDVYHGHPRSHMGDGGPKGIDIDREGRVLAVTYEEQRLTFLDLTAVLEQSVGHCPDQARLLSYELEVLERNRVLEAHVAALKRSMSYRLTTPLRRVKAASSKIRR